ncbi:hypothetical protein AAMO2058_000863300 [Amorphochlora amoebiformis]
MPVYPASQRQDYFGNKKWRENRKWRRAGVGILVLCLFLKGKSSIKGLGSGLIKDARQEGGGTEGGGDAAELRRLLMERKELKLKAPTIREQDVEKDQKDLLEKLAKEPQTTPSLPSDPEELEKFDDSTPITLNDGRQGVLYFQTFEVKDKNGKVIGQYDPRFNSLRPVDAPGITYEDVIKDAHEADIAQKSDISTLYPGRDRLIQEGLPAPIPFHYEADNQPTDIDDIDKEFRKVNNTVNATASSLEDVVSRAQALIDDSPGKKRSIYSTDNTRVARPPSAKKRLRSRGRALDLSEATAKNNSAAGSRIFRNQILAASLRSIRDKPRHGADGGREDLDDSSGSLELATPVAFDW